MSGDGPDVSVIIPVFNGERYLGAQLAALAAQSFDGAMEVIIADNGSTDRSLVTARAHADRLDLRIVDATRGRGQTVARNVGAEHARASKLLFLDQDDVVDHMYVSTMTRALDSAEVVAARMETTVLNGDGRHRDREVAQAVGLAEGQLLPWGYGGTLGIAAPTFAALGGFDERLPKAAEDEDLCWRAQLAGARLAYSPESVLLYRFPRDRWSLLRQGLTYGHAQTVVDWKYATYGVKSPSAWIVGRRVLTYGLRVILPGSLTRGRATFLLGRYLGYAKGRFSRSSYRHATCATPSGPHVERPMGAVNKRAPEHDLQAYVVHWRKPDWCSATVASLQASTVNVQVTVLNNSPEMSDEISAIKGAEVVTLGGNLGYAGAANVGLTKWLQKKEPYVLVTSHDCLVTPSTVAKLVAAADASPDVGILGPVWMHECEFSRHSGEVDGDPVIEAVDWVSGTCMLIRRECIDDSGLFDGGLGSYCEDVDLCLRARSHGWQVGRVNGAVMSSRGSVALNSHLLMRRNAITVMRRERGVAGGLRAYASSLVALLRNGAGAVAPARAAPSRAASRARALEIGPVVMAVGAVFRRPRPLTEPVRINCRTP